MNIKKNEIYIRKLGYEEAKIKLMVELDKLYLSGAERIKIIHGKGKGILKKMVEEYLSKQPFVKKYHTGLFYEGGAGVTIAVLE